MPPKGVNGPTKHHEDTGIPDGLFKKDSGLWMKYFIENIPADKLRGLPRILTNIHNEMDFRLDMQGVSTSSPLRGGGKLTPIKITTQKPQRHNLQVQINKACTLSSVKRERPNTVATALVPEDGSWSSLKIKQALVAGIGDRWRRGSSDVASSSGTSGKGRR